MPSVFTPPLAMSEELAAWSLRAPGQFSPRSRRLACDGIIDVLGCLWAGRADAVPTALRQAQSALYPGAAPVSPLVGGGRAPAPVAALVNGAAAHALDYDDNFMPAMSHASAVILPALLAIAATRSQTTGAELISAYLIAVQAQAEIGWATGYAHYVAGWHGTSTIGTVGTAAGAAWLAGLDAARIANAISISASLAAGFKGQFGSPAKPFHAGMAARNAVEAVALAKAGVHGNRDALERPQGFIDVFSGARTAPPWTPERLAPGSAHVIETVGLLPKRYPCCGSTHMVLDELLRLQAAEGFGPEDVTAIDTKVGIANWKNLAFPTPRTEMEARFSMQYCLAVALQRGGLELSDFTQQAVLSRAGDPLLSRISMSKYTPEEEGAAAGNMPHELVVHLRDGRRLVASRLRPRGSLAEPFTQAEQRSKFSDCAQALPVASVDALFETLCALDEAPDLCALAPFFAPSLADPRI